MSETNRTPAEVRAELSDLARPVAEQLRRGLVQQETRRLSGLAGPTLAFPATYLFLVVLMAPLGIDLQLPWLVLVLLTVMLPCCRVLLRWYQAQQQRVADAVALRAIDSELQLADRMATAHEFVEVAQPDGFQLAAIRDAQQRIQAAHVARPSRPAVAPESPRSLSVAGLAALALLWFASLVTVAVPVDVANPGGERQVAAVAQKPSEQPRDIVNQPKPEVKVAAQRTPRQAQKDSNSSSVSEDETSSDASRRGKNPIGSGRSAEARAAAGGGSERGQPSNQAQSTKGEKSAKPKAKKKPKSKKDGAEKTEDQKKPPQESGSTLGRGSGKGSSKSPTASPWSAKDQVVSDDEQDPEEDEEVDDENDESKARGGVQPNLRQRKPPVNRDLQISMGSGKPQDDANGRGGPGGPKKQRGVAQLVLGVTFPDHISAKPNPGMSKITQERIEPQAQQGDSINGEGRGARAAPMGHLSRRVLSPWMQDLVRSFYLSLREEGGPQ